MQYDLIGRTGVLGSRLSLGAWTFTDGDQSMPVVSKVDPALAEQLVGTAIDRGINFFDTADRYANGESEIVLGRTLKSRRNEVLIATKAGVRNGAALTATGLSRRHIRMSLEASLKRLGTDWIDFYIVHRDDPYTPFEETAAALDEVVRAGLVRYIGFSNWPAWKAAAAIGFQRANGLAEFCHGQVHYSLVSRDVEYDYLPMAEHFGIGTTIWSPLAMGYLSGKAAGDGEAEPKRHEQIDFIPFDRTMGGAAVDCLREIADARGASCSQVALAWLLAKRGVTSVILGASKLAHLEDSIGAADLTLTADDLAALDSVTEGRAPYPLWHNLKLGDPPVKQALAGRR
jgi:aryl-alcohol dehydrogenase-like predicted oxidoreductase